MATYGRNRQSIANIEEELHNLIFEHPRSLVNDAGEPVLPADALVDIIAGFSELHNDVELLSKDEEAQLLQFLDSNPGLAATPKLLVEFIALRTTTDEPSALAADPAATTPDEGSENHSPDHRGRHVQRGFYDDNSRSSSTDSVGTSVYRPHSRPSSQGPPKTPNTPHDSPFDASKRQRSAPLGNSAPSSWTKRPPPAHRRKSDSGRALSDSESTTATSTPSVWGRRNSRSRAPSNPTSPLMSSHSQPIFPSDSFSPLHSPPPRPHSRTLSYPDPQLGFNGLSPYYGSPVHGGDSSIDSVFSTTPLSSAENSLEEASFLNSINSLPMPRSASDSDSDSDGGEPSMLVYDRSATSSTASLEPMERMEALQRINTDLSKKLIEAERTLQNRLTEHETELEEMQSKLEELKSELTFTKKEEKELRAKERQNSTQISALESEIAKSQKSLENARISYQSLQKQYQEQCAESERYRNTLRRRDEEIKDYQDSTALHMLEKEKWVREQLAFEERITGLEHEIHLAQQTYVELNDQKQENMLLKETIDRMRYDMDEMRSSAANSMQQGVSGTNSTKGSLGRNFEAEMLRVGERGPLEDLDSSSETLVPHLEGEDTDSEDYIQTIITKTRKRKVPGRTSLSTFQLEETTKEYSDAFVQYDDASFHRPATAQTDPEPIIPKASLSTQTPSIPVRTFSIQTDPEPVAVPKVMVEIDIQTDLLEVDSESTSTGTQEDDDTSASSSSTLLPPTPKPQSDVQLHSSHLPDLPPAYNQVTHQDQDELALRIANETLKQWHKGAKLPMEPLRTGVSLDAIEEWKSLKDELGVECQVIEKMLEESGKTGRPRPTSLLPSNTSSSRSLRGGRFYRIYNTYVYGAGEPSGLILNMLLCAGASAAVVFFMTNGSSQTVIPGGPTYYDRAAWSSFNTMHASGEGFPGDGTSVVWSFLSRLSGGAARIVQGWPT